MTGRNGRYATVAASAALLFLFVPRASEHAFADGAPPTVDQSATLAGPTTGEAGTIVSYVMSVTNNGPDQARYLQVTLRWDPQDSFKHPEARFDYVGSDPANVCAYTAPTNGNTVGAVSCAWGDRVGDPPLPAGTTRTVSVRLRVLADAPSRLCAAAESMQAIQIDPNPANDGQCLDFDQEAAPSPPPAPTPPPPVAPSIESFSFATSMPHATEYDPYNASVIAPEPSGVTPPTNVHLVGGAVPPGLVLSNGGDLTGRPTSVGAFTFSVAASYPDVANSEQRSRFTVVVDSPYLAGSTVSASSGVPKCRARLSTTALPTWITATAAPGVISRPAPYLLGARHGAAAVLLTHPLLAPARRAPDRIVWVVRPGATSMPVKLHLQRMVGRAYVGKSQNRSIRNGRAAALHLAAGCWRVELSWGSARDTLDLQYLSR